MRILILCFAAGLSLSAQTMVEAGLGAARATTSTAPAAGLGKSMAGMLSNLDKTLKAADKAASSETIILPKETPAAPAKTYEPIKNAETGLAYEELIERFGPPSLEIAAGPGVKKLTYSGKEGTTRIEVKDGKVSTIDTVKPQQQSVVLTLPK
jgi:hypothetical protein